MFKEQRQLNCKTIQKTLLLHLVGVRNIVQSMRVCLSVCLSVCPHAYPWTHVRTSPNFPCMLHMAVAQSSSDGIIIYYVYLGCCE